MRTGLWLVVAACVIVPVAPVLRASPAVTTDEPVERDWLGQWRGTIAVGTGEPLDGGLIALSEEGGHLTATVGPTERVRYRTSRLARTPKGLRFEVYLPGDETRLLVYDLAIEGGAMTGSVTLVRHGLTAPGRLTFERE